MTSHSRALRIKNKELILAPLVAIIVGMMYAIPIIQTAPAQAIEKQEIPLATYIYNGNEYLMNAHIINEEQAFSRANFPDLPDNYEPQMIVEQGKTVTLEFNGEKPSKISAYLVDYDADITESYPLRKINDNTFELTQIGIKTLEAVATFSEGLQISYTLLVDVKESV